ncbi:LPXTG cell wall anchor domain-containing protein, partial [Enterococcus faecium]
PGESAESTETSTTPSTSEAPTEKTSEEPTKPVEKPKEETEVKPTTPKLAEPEKAVTVTVTPSGQVTSNKDQGTSVPIITSNVEELTHIPTPATPLKAATGQAIVGVLDGVPLVQNEQGKLVKDLSIPVKKLPSGNIEVKTADGKTKVLPKTGEKMNRLFLFVGSLFTLVSGVIFFKKYRFLRHS